MDPKDQPTGSGPGYNLPARSNKVVQPLHDDPAATSTPTANAAADMIREKVDKLFANEPKAKEKIEEVEGLKHRSKHQQFMYDLSHSGKSLADIQTEWHAYYTDLPNNEKHEVWQEFYATHQNAATHAAHQTNHDTQVPEPVPTHSRKHAAHKKASVVPDLRTVTDVKHQLLGKVQTRGKLQRKHHLQSVFFGLGMGTLTLLILLFGFFNERFIAPFITPSRTVSSTPIIIDPNGTNIGPESKLIIPKINVEIPVVYDEPTINEDAIQRALERGVVHYPTTSNPGEIGNGVIFGHSANNILNKGKYKFAFVLLKKMEVGDTFYVQKDGKRFVYRVYDKKIVPPTDVSVLYPSSTRPATFTLITCDPPGTSLNRLVVTAEQVTPDPTANIASTAKQAPTEPKILASNSPSLWQKIKNWF